ncbi:MAG: DUF4266 domain-containing protein [Moraxellaceae bacterium]|nr:DUF4266 domain-containing protein [Moraxellaceae bacterium]MDZ4387800.1 DUF4266 domain-containing protein [Moraxellaceae bacterium]
MTKIISCFALLLLAGCSIQPVQPWQRATLADPAMAWEMDPLLSDYNEQTQVSKEAASGGATLGGGGCGCN